MFGFFSRDKTFTATVNSGTNVLEVGSDDNLLSAALAANIAWPHNCQVGSCGACRCKLVSGKISALCDFSYVLDTAELESGMILACQTRLTSDVSIEVDLAQAPTNLTSATSLRGVIAQSNRLTHDILQLVVQLPDAAPSYRAGQYAELSVEGINPRPYSFATAPQNVRAEQLVFHVRLVPGGEMSGWLHEQSRTGCHVNLSAPHGSFYLRDCDGPILCVAGGSGMAPIKALLEQIAYEGFTQEVTYLFGARTQGDLYCLAEMKALAEESNGHFRFVPVLSDEPADSDWGGLRGLVTGHIENQSLDLAKCRAYLCGPPAMIDEAIDTLRRRGLGQENIFFDKFLDASHLPGLT